MKIVQKYFSVMKASLIYLEMMEKKQYKETYWWKIKCKVY